MQRWRSHHKSNHHSPKPPSLGGGLLALVQACVEVTLDPQQEQSWDQLRCLYRGPSRVRLTADPPHHTHTLTLLTLLFVC